MQDDSHYMKRATKLGPEVERLIMILLQQGNGFIDTRKIWGILSLDKKYSADEINRACRNALECGEFTYRAVLAFLTLQPATGHAVKPVSQNNKFVRPLSLYQEELDLLN